MLTIDELRILNSGSDINKHVELMNKADDVDMYLIRLIQRFKEKIEFDKYYLSYSGGKDSHFLYWFIKEILQDDKIKIVGINTYMEHHEILKRILKNSDIVLLPKLKPFEIKAKYGSPCFSKWQDDFIDRYQRGSRSESTMQRIEGRNKDGTPTIYKLNNKARDLLLSGELHRVSPKCCTYLKKKPAKDFEEESGLKPILGIRGGESISRKGKYQSCLNKKGTFTPLWDMTDDIIDEIYRRYSIEIPEVYEHIKRTGCFTPDVEICTNKGFIRLDSLTGSEKILSIDDNGFTVFKDYKKVEFNYDGELINVKLQDINVLCTPDHKFLGYNRDTKLWENRFADNISRLSIPANMRFNDDNSSLTNLEKLYIAIQADGSIESKSKLYKYCFHLKKERKINHLIDILDNLNIEYSYNKQKDGTIKINFNLDTNAKDLNECFRFEDIGTCKAKEIINETILWDGCKDKAGRYHYCCINKSQTDFYSIIASIAGYSHYQYVNKRTRKIKETILYNIIIYDKENRNFKQGKKKMIYYKGKVHCVDIGDRLCLFRKNGKTFVAYNCMGCPYGSYKHDTEKELRLINGNQKKFVCEYFKESYKVLGINVEEVLKDNE